MCACVFWGDEKRERFKKGSVRVTPSLLVIMPKKTAGKTRTPQCDVAKMTGCPHSDQPRVLLLQGTLHDDPVLWKHPQTLPEKNRHGTYLQKGGCDAWREIQERAFRQESCGV